MNIDIFGESRALEGVVLMGRILGIFAVASALALASGVAQAAELAFTITGAGHTIIFDLPQNPTPDAFTLGKSFGFDDVSGTEDGSPVGFDVIFFVPTLGDGDLHIGFNSPYFGDQLYTWPGKRPDVQDWFVRHK